MSAQFLHFTDEHGGLLIIRSDVIAGAVRFRTSQPNLTVICTTTGNYYSVRETVEEVDSAIAELLFR